MRTWLSSMRGGSSLLFLSVVASWLIKLALRRCAEHQMDVAHWQSCGLKKSCTPSAHWNPITAPIGDQALGGAATSRAPKPTSPVPRLKSLPAGKTCCGRNAVFDIHAYQKPDQQW